MHTPLLVEHHGQTDILVSGKNRLTAFDAKTHAELWQYGEGEGPFNGEIIVSPVYGDGMVFLQLWRQSPIHAIRLTGNGQPPELVWVSEKPGPQEPSLLYYRGLLYALMDNGVLVCLDGKTGKEIYRERLGGGMQLVPDRQRRTHLLEQQRRHNLRRQGRDESSNCWQQTASARESPLHPRSPETSCFTERTRTCTALESKPNR